MIGFRERPSSQPTRPAVIVATAVAALAIALALTWFALVAPRGVPGVSYYELDAEFANAANVGVGSDVRVSGRRVGQVTDTRLHAGRATLSLQLASSEGPLRSDSRARIALKGLLGAKFVEITPGRTGQELESGATLTTRQTSTAVELLDVAQALDAPHRRRLQHTVRGLGAGFLGRGEDANETLRAAPDVLADTTSWTSAVLEREGAAARLNPSAASAAEAFDPVRQELAEGFRPAARVMQAFADRRDAVRRTLEAAPPALAALREGLDAATPLLDETAGLARATTRLTRRAPAALRETRLLLREAGSPLQRTEPLLRSLAASVPSTLRLLDRLAPVAAPAGRALRNSQPQLVELGRRPCDLFRMARNWRSLLGYGVAPGSGDPLGNLDDDAGGLGGLNSLRTLAISPKSTDALTVDAPAPAGSRPPNNAYPGPCLAWEDRAP